MSYILITGVNENAAKIEVIYNQGHTRICKGENNIYPLKISLATAVYTNGKIIICGGHRGYSNTDECYVFQKDKGWVLLSKMNQARRGSAAIPIEGGLIVIGGSNTITIAVYQYDLMMKSSQIVMLDGMVKEGPELPEPTYFHCIAYYKEEDVIFVTGGGQTVWKLKDKEKFTLLGTSRMIQHRYGHGCGIFRSNLHEGRPLLVAAGGYASVWGNGGKETGKGTCEFFDFTEPNSQWQLCGKYDRSFHYLLLGSIHCAGTS